MNKKRSGKLLVFSIVSIFLLFSLTGCIKKNIKDSGENSSKTENIDNKDDKIDNKDENSKLKENGDSSSTEENINSKDSATSLELEKNKKFTGRYKLKVIGYSGELILKFEKTGFTGTIFFRGWGKGIPQPLKDLKVKGSKIHFIRSITNKEEMLKFGSKRFFKQKYVGSFSKDGKVIRGSYISSGSITNWKAYK